MPPRLRLFYSSLIAGLLLIPALALYREMSGRPDIWWTPLPMALSLADSRDRVEIYARGRQLGTLLDQKQLWIGDQTDARTLGVDEIRLRFNNWDRVRAAKLPMLLLYAAACGAGMALLVLVATGRLGYRGHIAHTTVSSEV